MKDCYFIMFFFTVYETIVSRLKYITLILYSFFGSYKNFKRSTVIKAGL